MTIQELFAKPHDKYVGYLRFFMDKKETNARDHRIEPYQLKMRANGKVPHRTRYWCNYEGNNGVQFRTDADPMVWMYTNIGWVPIGNAPTTETEAVKFAAEMAEGYGYEECTYSQASYMAGWFN